ncbi:hypothetical protein, partial [Streptomyces sp. NPDC057052]|uniref:hypothetical protein n=1 Tax=Streptomyces sp. NPDC057052 TaxID=3346010 RepID=UPI00362A0812
MALPADTRWSPHAVDAPVAMGSAARSAESTEWRSAGRASRRNRTGVRSAGEGGAGAPPSDPVRRGRRAPEKA